MYVQMKRLFHQGPLLLTWIYFPAWTNDYIHYTVDQIIHPCPNFNDAPIEVWDWIRNFILHFIMDVVTYPYWD